MISKSQADEIRFHRFYKEPDPVVELGSFSRHGGVSKAPFNSNNISFGVGDAVEKVRSNRQAMKKHLGLKSLISAHQVHGNKIHHVSSRVTNDYVVDGYDALITDIPGVGLLIGHADCQAVLIYDKTHRAIAAIHSGWRGSVINIIKTTITAMHQAFSSNPGDMHVGVSPSLGPCCSEFIHHEEELPEEFQQFKTKSNYFDFWQITRHQLVQCGIPGGSIFIAGVCTSCSADYFSYRRSCRKGTGITGRNGSVISLI